MCRMHLFRELAGDEAVIRWDRVVQRLSNYFFLLMFPF